MQEWARIALTERGGGLIILLIGIMLAIAGSYHLLTDKLDEINAEIQGIKTTLQKDSDALHDLDKRITILEIKSEQ